MRILRIVHDYWPCAGGNERWSWVHDRWFTETAGDDVQVVVLRPEFLYRLPGYREALEAFAGVGEFTIPGIPRVKAYQEVFPAATSVRLAGEYRRRLRPWLNGSYDVIITQIGRPHAAACWRGRPVVYEPTTARLDWAFTSLRRDGLRNWARARLTGLGFRTFDVIPASHLVMSDLAGVGLGSRGFPMAYLVDPDAMRAPPSTPGSVRQKQLVDDLAGRFPFVLFQFNRLVEFKRPDLLLDIAERLPECAIVFGGDGPMRQSLERRVEATKSLRGRVCFLGFVDPSHVGSIAECASTFVMTSTRANYNTSLCETMGLGVAPVVVVDTGDLPHRIGKKDLALLVSSSSSNAAAAIRALLSDPLRCKSMAAEGEAYVRLEHSPQRMQEYRERLLELADSYGRIALAR